LEHQQNLLTYSTNVCYISMFRKLRRRLHSQPRASAEKFSGEGNGKENRKISKKTKNTIYESPGAHGPFLLSDAHVHNQNHQMRYSFFSRKKQLVKIGDVSDTCFRTATKP